MRRLVFLLSPLLCCITLNCSSQAKLNGVYAGSDFLYSPYGMQRYDYSFYFRPDGSFCDELEKPDWQTKVNGTYTINGNELTLKYSNTGKINKMTIQPDGYLFDGSYSLFKFDIVNSIPAISFNFITASGGGGIGTGLPYAGGTGRNYLTFDGKGHFSHSSFGSASVVSDIYTHGSTTSFKGDGEYSIRQSVLALHYKDGKSITRSFFFSPGKTGMALINGSIYYEVKTDNEQETTNQNSDNSINNKEENTESETTAISILQNAHEMHGGKALDNMKTARLQGTAGTTGFIMLLDLVNQKIRVEFYTNGQRNAIDQLEGNTGWHWANGKTAPLPGSRINELKSILKTGILGLRTDLLKNITILKLKDENDGMHSVLVRINGQEYAWIFDAKNRLSGEVSKQNGIVQSSNFTDFRSVNGILLPFSTKEKRGKESYTITYSSITINPVLTEADWKK